MVHCYKFSKCLKDNQKVLRTILWSINTLWWNEQIPWKTQSTKAHKRDIDNLNSPIAVKEMESVTDNLPKREALGSDGFTSEFYQTFEEILLILHKYVQKIK